MQKYKIKNIFNNIRSKKAFTMLEILMITIIVGVWLLSIVVAVTKAKTITNEIKQKTIATQLAKEGIEMIYQIRNSNLLQHPNYKDHCRLNTDFRENCDDSNHPDRMTEENYILMWQTITGTSETLDISDWISTWEKIFNLCLTWWQRISCPWSDNQTKYGKFFRTIEWDWLYIKDVNHTWWVKIVCNAWVGWWDAWPSWGIAYHCAEWDELRPMEYRFCSKVEYIWTKTWSVEICGVLTSFFD